MLEPGVLSTQEEEDTDRKMLVRVVQFVEGTSEANAIRYVAPGVPVMLREVDWPGPRQAMLLSCNAGWGRA